MLKTLDLFSGIGGFSLGLERTGGFKTVAFCEIEEFPRRVLAKHWPDVPIHRDVRELKAEHVGAVDVICGGFPCQDISTAGKGAGLAGERSGLWSEYARLVGELRPAYVIVENVAALLGRGLGTVLGDLAALGYDAEWHCIPASAVGATHRRDRLWIVAYPGSGQFEGELVGGENCGTPSRGEGGDAGEGQASHGKRLRLELGAGSASVAVGVGQGLEGRSLDREGAGQWTAGQGVRSHPGHWLPEPDVGRVAHGVPSRVHRLRALGNAVVPQIPELIGRAILKAEGLTAPAVRPEGAPPPYVRTMCRGPE